MKSMHIFPRSALGAAAATAGLAAIALASSWFIIPNKHDPSPARAPPASTANQDEMRLHPELLRIRDDLSIDQSDFDDIVETFSGGVEPDGEALERIRSIVSCTRADESTFIALASVLGGSPFDASLASCLLRSLFHNATNAQAFGPMAADFVSRICDQFSSSPAICANLIHAILLSVDHSDSIIPILIENNFITSLVEISGSQPPSLHSVAAQLLVHAAYQSGLYPTTPDSPTGSPWLLPHSATDATALSSSQDNPQLLESKTASNPASPPSKSVLELGPALDEGEYSAAASALEPLVYELLQTDPEDLDVLV